MSVVAVRWAAIMFYRKITQKKVVIIVIIIIIAIIIIIIIAVIVIIIIAVTTSLSMGIRGTPVTRSSPSLSYKRILPFKPILFPPMSFLKAFYPRPRGLIFRYHIGRDRTRIAVIALAATRRLLPLSCIDVAFGRE